MAYSSANGLGGTFSPDLRPVKVGAAGEAEWGGTIACITGKLRAHSSCLSQVAVGPVSKPVRATIDA